MKKEIEIIVPSNLSEITLEVFQRIKLILEDEDLNAYDKEIKVISIVCNMSELEVKRMNKNDVAEISVIVNKILNSTPIHQMTFEMNGVKYGMIPNLDQMSFGEYIDIINYIKSEDTYNKFMSVLYRPIIAESRGLYQIEEYTGDEDFEVMNNCPMSVLKSSLVFFYDLMNDLQIAIQNYLQRLVEKQEKIIASKGTSTENGDGTAAYINSLKVTLEHLKKLQN